MGAALWEVFTEEPAFREAESIALFEFLEFIDEVSIEAAPTLFAAWLALLLKTFWFCACKISAKMSKKRSFKKIPFNYFIIEKKIVNLWIDTKLTFSFVVHYLGRL